MYTNLPSSSKDQLMDLLSIWLDNFENDVSLEIIIVIKDNFFIDSAIENISRQVVNVLAKASSIDKFNSEIRKYTSLLKKLMGIMFCFNNYYICILYFLLLIKYCNFSFRFIDKYTRAW